MNQRLVFVVAFIAVFIGILGLGGFFSTPVAEKEILGVEYRAVKLVKELNKGDVLRKDYIRTEFIPENRAKSLGIESDSPFAITPGMVANRDLSADTILVDDDFVLPNQPGYISAILRDDMVPYPLNLDKDKFYGSGIRVGDAIDIMMLASDEQNIGESAQSKYIKLFRTLTVSSLIESVRVLGIDEESQKDKLALTIELDRQQIARMVIAKRIGIIEVIKSYADTRAQSKFEANTHDVLPNYQSVIEIRGNTKELN